MAASLRQVFAMTLLLQVISLEATVSPRFTSCTCNLDARTVTCTWDRDPSDGNETTYTVAYWEVRPRGPEQTCDVTDHGETSSCTFEPSSLYIQHKVVLTRTDGDTGLSARSFPWEITPYLSVKPNAPSLTATAERSRQVTLRWESSIPPAFRTVVDESGCEFQYRDSRNVTWRKPEDALKQKSFTLRGLRPGTEYAVRIRCEAEYWGEYGEPVYVRTWEEAPGQGPRVVEAKLTPDTDKDGLADATVSWEKIPLDDQNGAILHYQLNLTEEGGEVFRSVSVDANTTEHTFRDLAVGQAYQGVLWAVNAAGQSPAVPYSIGISPGVEPVRTPAPGFIGSTTMTVVLASVLGGLLLLSLVIFCNRRAIGKRFKMAKDHLWPRIPRPENFLAPPTADEDYQYVDDVHVRFVYLPPEPEIVDDFEEERRRLLALHLPDGPEEGTIAAGQASRPVSTTTGEAHCGLGRDVRCHGSREEVAGMPPVAKAIWVNVKNEYVNKDAVPMATEGEKAKSTLNYIRVYDSSRYVAKATGGTPGVSSGDGAAGSQVMPSYVQFGDRSCPVVAMATEGDQAASSELAVNSNAGTAPREDGSAGSKVIPNYVQTDHQGYPVTMATEGDQATTPRKEGSAGSQAIQGYVQVDQVTQPVTMATEGDKAATSELAVRPDATETTPRKDASAGSQAIPSYVQVDHQGCPVTMATHSVPMATEVATPETETSGRKGSKVIRENGDHIQQQAIPYVTMATEGVDGVSSGAGAPEVPQAGKVRRAGELTVCQGTNSYVQIQDSS
ncbi:uncharacterized protein LOC144902809 [Branchiostoma floridae x Branchiostoma belcheri]